ncbi:UDP-glucose/GDP-mannose dehydrogenase family protein [bacterium]|nr:UDP-glucose/GDP-mannose dehydrogenase family protein [bacterium]
MNICIIGTGYVGLVTGSCLADSGNDVTCLDIDKSKIESLKNGEVGIYEPGLEEIVTRNYKEGRLSFTTNYKEAIEKSRIIFLAVSTPPKEDGSADLSYILSASKELAKNINGYKVIVTKSTVPVGTTNKIKEVISELTDESFDVASNPEFLKEGSAVNDFMFPDRIVIGVDSLKAESILRDLYEPFLRKEDRLIFVDIKSSEVSKYASNSMLATRISFMNEMANLCEKVGADISNVRKIMSQDKRIGKEFLYPGLGYGGSCFPKDVKAIIDVGKKNNLEMNLCSAVDKVNISQRFNFFNKIKTFFGTLEGKTCAIWGLSFKPNTDDIREAPSVDIVQKLIDEKVNINANDPVAMDNFEKRFGKKIKYFKNNYDALKDVDFLVINTEWSIYRQPNFDLIKKNMKSPIIFDGRNLYNKIKLKELGFYYSNVGYIPSDD